MIVVDNQKPIFVECSEFPTRPEYSALSDVLARTCSGYLLCFYLVNRESFEKLRTHRDFILKAKEKDSLPFVLVGCKSDLEQDRVIPRRGRHIEPPWCFFPFTIVLFMLLTLLPECEELAREFDCPYFETSAKDDVNVTAPFEEIVREIRRYESLPEPAPKKKKKKMMMNECFDRCVVL